MSGLDWDKDRRRSLHRMAEAQSSEARHDRGQRGKQGDSEAFTQAFSDAVAAKRANKFYQMPPGISEPERRQLWARVHAFLKGGN
jgi:hypothetical protein